MTYETFFSVLGAVTCITGGVIVACFLVREALAAVYRTMKAARSIAWVHRAVRHYDSVEPYDPRKEL